MSGSLLLLTWPNCPGLIAPFCLLIQACGWSKFLLQVVCPEQSQVTAHPRIMIYALSARTLPGVQPVAGSATLLRVNFIRVKFILLPAPYAWGCRGQRLVLHAAGPSPVGPGGRITLQEVQVRPAARIGCSIPMPFMQNLSLSPPLSRRAAARPVHSRTGQAQTEKLNRRIHKQQEHAEYRRLERR